MSFTSTNRLLGKGCVAMVPDGVTRMGKWGRNTYRCHRPVKVVREGQGYCGLHDPVAMATRWQVRWQARNRP